jgi:hypothetical protein
MSSGPIQRCPVCSRDLSLWPPPNSCPDCGLEYDQHTRVWRSSESWARLALIYTAVGLVVGGVIAGLQRLSFGQARYPALPLLTGLLAPALGLLLRRLVGGRITGRFVALTPGGILVGTRPQPTRVPWDDFEQLTEQRGVPKLRCRQSPNLVPLDDIFDGPTELAEFRAALLEAARRHGRPQSPPIAPGSSRKTPP